MSRKQKRKVPVQTIITVIMVCIVAAIVIGISLTKPDRHVDGLSFPSRKSWWTKRISNDFHTSGRLAERQIKYAAEAGFKSVVSLFNFTEGLQASDGVYLPSTGESMGIAEISGIPFEALPVDPAKWNELEALKLFVDTVADLPRPTLVACNDSYHGTLFALLYLTMSEANSATDPLFTVDDIFTIGRAIGHDYTVQPTRDFIILVTGGNITADTPKETLTLNMWKEYWLAKPVADDWFIAGQTYKEQLSLIQAAGFRSVINLRRGVTDRGKPSQEQVTLLNIIDHTDTYAAGGRQSTSRLQQTRIDPTKPIEYISSTSTVNYESRNPGEFGDDIGYNEQVEQEYITGNTDLMYYHLPVGGQYGYNVDTFHVFRDFYREASVHGPVLAHCRTGYRSAIFTLTYVGYVNCKNSSWAIEKAHKLGYHFTEQRTPAEYRLIRDVLDGELNEECSESTTTKTPKSAPVSRSAAFRAQSWIFACVSICMFCVYS